MSTEERLRNLRLDNKCEIRRATIWQNVAWALSSSEKIPSVATVPIITDHDQKEENV